MGEQTNTPTNKRLSSVRSRGVIRGWLDVFVRIALFPFQFLFVWFKPKEEFSTATARHSERVVRLKIFTVSLSVFLILALILWPFLDEEVKLSFESVSPTDNEEPSQVSMQKPRFYGVDKKNQPYQIEASSATQMDDNTVKMVQVTAKASKISGEEYALKADHATYYVEQEHISLSGDVHIEMQQDYHLYTETLEANVEQGFANGVNSVTINGPLGELVANEFYIKENGNVLHFRGEVKAIIKPEQGSPSKI